MLACFYFWIGAIIASFSCCVGFRMGNGQSPWSPSRSYCDRCKHPLLWWPLVPVIGWLVQAGRCYFCRARISPYLLCVEILVGATVAILCPGRDWVVQAIYLLAAMSLTVVATSDYYHGYIYPIWMCGLLPAYYTMRPRWQMAEVVSTAVLVMILVGFCIGLKQLGSGDVMYLCVLLVVMGLYPTLLVIVIGSVLTLILVPVFKRELPFMPGLAMATALVLIWLN